MSRNLPEFPDLEHLKKQAKVLLRELQQHDPETTLTQAQHALAREYGFASWPKLKAHVKSLPSRPNTSPKVPGPGPDSGGAYGGVDRSLFPRFTVRARRTIFFSRYFAQRGTRRIEAADLLLGVIQADLDLINRLLPGRSAGEDISEAVERRRTTREGISTSADPLSSECRRILERAAREADRLRHQQISTGHFLLGFLDNEVSLTTPILTDILAENGILLDMARVQIARYLSEESL
jgi:ClpA/ClpB-like protein/glyoxalase superfamily protein